MIQYQEIYSSKIFKKVNKIETFIFIVFLMFCGYLFRIYKIFPEQTAQVLNKYIIYVSLPAMVLLEVPKIILSKDIFIPLIIPWVITICGAFTIYVLSKLFNWDNKTTGVLLLVGVLGNTSFLGIPIVSHYLGDDALPYVMIYDQLGSFLLLSTYGAIVVSLYSNKNEKPNSKDILKKIFTFPPFIALILASFLHGIKFGEKTIDILSLLGDTLVPIALISVGFSLQLKIEKKDLSAFSFGLSTKLILIPFYSFIIVYIFNLDGLATDVSILESAMGPMITAGIVASASGFNEKLSSSIVGYGVVLSFLTTAIVAQL
ncbi:MAG: AEC family transporter, partial [Campylobacterota bacterium]|nr:AEC family transporter [Campylobacterota bacterium]